ncbi:hydroxyacylglutathione hydrolase [Niveispirillum sp. SYP-B3756]|uniref:hydroxyacylglutathione hydrolase n=1 Tax=Niveispirillum sp. SYP-B3756 TaxID=2662178 RepID=UPI0012919DD9|nr:hydroxyacylglutathione hydrolase [Niveispirillum sp. SYP-B3756]MQP68334.1 hydroxyacylglutathione hydrolase [Niveispirillum sp. SYP-B3756]
MSLTIHQFPCLQDNYAFLCKDTLTGKVACIDSPDAQAILAEASKIGWGIDYIFNTHWHPDHAGGNATIVAATGAKIIGPEEVRKISEIDQVVVPGDMVALGATSFNVIDVGGHTLGHVAFHAPDAGVAFVGDALFPLGCGRIFEGTAEQMWNGLQRLAQLPPDTEIYAAHEYARGNAGFAMSIDASAATRARAQLLLKMVDNGVPTVPCLLKDELATNPFLRAPFLKPEYGPARAVEAFAAVRSAKDNFKG